MQPLSRAHPSLCNLWCLQLISDKKALSERCEGVLTELKQVDLKYTKKIAQMQQQHEMVSSLQRKNPLQVSYRALPLR